MAAQLITDRLFPIDLEIAKRAATRAPRPNNRLSIDTRELVGLSAAEVSKRDIAIQGEMDKLARMLGLFLIGLVLLGLLIVSAAPRYSSSRAQPSIETSRQVLGVAAPSRAPV